MITCRTTRGLQLLAPYLMLAMAAPAAPPADLPEAEKALADTVDPWGLPFSDQWTRFRSHFATQPEAPFAVGIAHDLVKIQPTKYWFRGETWPAGGADATATERWAAAGTTQAFQVAVLPRVGAAEAVYRIQAEAPGVAISVYREVFVKTSPAAAYPRGPGERWPDPLLPENTATVGGTDAGVFWVDVALPATAPAGTVACRVTIESAGVTARVTVPIHVVPGLDLDAKGFRFFSWFRRGKLTEAQYRCHLPIRLQMRAPLVDAPNMQIDNPALEHRLAMWMSSWYGAKAVFIWAGNAYTFADDFWKTLALDGKLSPYPYAGVHNGNGWVVYPSPDGAGTVPSLRLKVIRAGLEDVALLAAARRQFDAGRIKGKQAAELKALLNPVPGVFVHPQYFDRLPETLLARREAILRLCAAK